MSGSSSLLFLGYDLDERTPDHSVLSKARRRFGVTVYHASFTAIVRQCERAGLIVGQRLSMNSTLVRANASRDSTRSRVLLDQVGHVEEHIDALRRANPAPAADGGGDDGNAETDTAAGAPEVAPLVVVSEAAMPPYPSALHSTDAPRKRSAGSRER